MKNLMTPIACALRRRRRRAFSAFNRFTGSIAIAFVAGGVEAHDAPSGWSYDASCCSTIDCREVKASDVAEVWNGYLIRISKMQEIVPYGDTRIKDSPDGRFHWCSVSGRDDGRTICLYVPPRGY